MATAAGAIKKDLRATWRQALLGFFTPILILFTVRWLLIEPYVIPSGSMIPTLLIHDHIFVNKLAYGIHVPFSQKWIVNWKIPNRFDIIVFRYPQNPEIFYVKRVLGLPGDRISVRQGEVLINGEAISQKKTDETGFEYYDEQGHTVRYLNHADSEYNEFVVPEGHLFAMGDNRDQSSDSRFWGAVPLDHLIGRASFIWLSCRDTLATARYLCDPQTIRWNRIFQPVNTKALPPFEE